MCKQYPFADYTLKGGVTGVTLGTTPAHLFKSLVEATAFGSRAIMEHLEKEGVKVTEVIGVGGISLKSPYVMQTLSDVMGLPIKVAAAQQAGALGAAMLASVVGGLYATVEEAQQCLGQGVLASYQPDWQKSTVYAEKYKRYLSLAQFLENS